MIGTELVSLAPAAENRRIYNTVWRLLIAEPGYSYRFGNIPTWLTKSARLDAFWNWKSGKIRAYKFVVTRGDAAIGVATIEHDRQNEECFLVMGLLELYRGKKLGSITGRLLLRKCFKELGARRVESSALSTNPASINMQDGMILEGTLKSKLVIAGKEVDELVFRMLKTEWDATHLYAKS